MAPSKLAGGMRRLVRDHGGEFWRGVREGLVSLSATDGLKIQKLSDTIASKPFPNWSSEKGRRLGRCSARILAPIVPFRPVNPGLV